MEFNPCAPFPNFGDVVHCHFIDRMDDSLSRPMTKAHYCLVINTIPKENLVFVAYSTSQQNSKPKYYNPQKEWLFNKKMLGFNSSGLQIETVFKFYNDCLALLEYDTYYFTPLSNNSPIAGKIDTAHHSELKKLLDQFKINEIFNYLVEEGLFILEKNCWDE